MDMERIDGIRDSGHLRVHAPMLGLRKTEISLRIATIIVVVGAVFLAIAVSKSAHDLDILQNTSLNYRQVGSIAGIATLLVVITLGLHKVINGLQLRRRSIKVNDNLDFVDQLPPELSLKIFSYLNGLELSKSRRISKAWCALAGDDSLWKTIYLERASFGGKDWEKYFGKIKDAPPLPQNYYEILKSPDPAEPKKMMVTNWMLLLIPEDVDDKPPNLNNIGMLVKAKKIHENAYHNISQEVNNADKLLPTEKSHWVLIRTVIPASRNKTIEDQVKLVSSYVDKTKVAYRIPTPREYVIFNFAAYAKYGKRPYGDKPRTAGRSLFMINGFYTYIGNFSWAGLDVLTNLWDGGNVGVGLLREF